jgi:hypothetical protein
LLVPAVLAVTATARTVLTAHDPPVESTPLAATATAPTPTRDSRCGGLTHGDVLGPRPTYTPQRLAAFPNDDTLCTGLWLPRPRARLVPQSMALGTHHTAWLVGYRWGPAGERPCRLFRLDLRTGRRVVYQPRVVGHVGTRPEQYCRHGGGLLRARARLWIAEKHKLWMYDPTRAGSSPQADRVWRIQMPVQGSSIVATDDLIGLVPFSKTGTPLIRWYRFDDVLRAGVTDLADTAEPPKQIAPARVTPVPTYVQGAAFGPHGRLYLTRSSPRCGELMALGGRRVAFVPGAEQIQVGPRAERLWVVSESGARPFQAMKRPPPLTPAIASFAWPDVLRGPASTCRFDG